MNPFSDELPNPSISIPSPDMAGKSSSDAKDLPELLGPTEGVAVTDTNLAKISAEADSPSKTLNVEF
ncbi:MAG: hypothetical protein F6K40_10750 [Okeania sp. SIO3I5]|uniref:hypothetical protein n=1 Tax=Okeania sp. SIO3I5 TaxID=2607805 RepID=UPI0013BB245C|nr:hypothetical protein [Okeania sp. SIO3I5]NEQ36729.1 hypothetical protein [Okeania sp. SIO3I5]